MIKKIKLFLFFILASFHKSNREKVEAKERQEQVQKAWSIVLSDAKEEKLAATIEWSKPENIAARIKEHEEAAEAALKAAGGRKELEPLPPLDELPAYMRGQSESTIRAMLKNGFVPEAIGE